jgi:hypothetical protein
MEELRGLPRSFSPIGLERARIADRVTSCNAIITWRAKILTTWAVSRFRHVGRVRVSQDSKRGITQIFYKAIDIGDPWGRIDLGSRKLRWDRRRDSTADTLLLTGRLTKVAVISRSLRNVCHPEYRRPFGNLESPAGKGGRSSVPSWFTCWKIHCAEIDSGRGSRSDGLNHSSRMANQAQLSCSASARVEHVAQKSPSTPHQPRTILASFLPLLIPFPPSPRERSTRSWSRGAISIVGVKCTVPPRPDLRSPQGEKLRGFCEPLSGPISRGITDISRNSRGARLLSQTRVRSPRSAMNFRIITFLFAIKRNAAADVLRLLGKNGRESADCVLRMRPESLIRRWLSGITLSHLLADIYGRRFSISDTLQRGF